MAEKFSHVLVCSNAITSVGIALIIVNVKAAANRELPYYIKAYLYCTDKENYKSVVRKIDDVLEDIIIYGAFTYHPLASYSKTSSLI